MPTGQEVCLQPAFEHVFAQHLHHPSAPAEPHIRRASVLFPLPRGHLQGVVQFVRDEFVGCEDAEVLRILHNDVTQPSAQRLRRAVLHRSRSGHIDGVVAERRQVEVFEQIAAIGMRIHSHAEVACRTESGDLREQPSVAVEELFWLVAP